MIYYLSTRANSEAIHLYLDHLGSALKGIIVPLTYEEFFAARQFGTGTYVFADLELLTRDGKERAARLWHQLAQHGCKLLNHPQRTMCRFELLRTLYQRGINQSNVYRAHESLRPSRYPVFIRS